LGDSDRALGTSRFLAWAEALVELAEEILACCIAYLHFVHPIWSELKKTGGVTRECHVELALAATKKVEGSWKEAYDGLSFDPTSHPTPQDAFEAAQAGAGAVAAAAEVTPCSLASCGLAVLNLYSLL
jgi:hypothetical protein